MFSNIRKILIALIVLTISSSSISVLAQTEENKTELKTVLKTEDKIRIDIVSDVVCPWCAIGYKRLSQAIEELDIEDQVEVHWHPFELNPSMIQEGINADQYLMAKMRLSPEALKQKRISVAKTGEASGFTFNYYEEMRKPNTLFAHVLLEYAKAYDKQTELKVRLQEAYFKEKKNIGNRAVLRTLLQEVGLNAEEGIAKLDDANALKRVRDEEAFWRERGVRSIPTMVFNKKIARQGANPVESYKALLVSLLDEK